MKFITDQDIVISSATGDVVGIIAPDSFADTPVSRLRLVNGVITDIEAVTSWFIDDTGQRHIAQLDDSWQPLSCEWDALITLNGATWDLVTKQNLDDQSVYLVEVRLDAIADSVYTRSPSRVARYERKRDQAMAYKAEGYPTPIDTAIYHYIAGEAIERSISEQAMADLILARSDLFASFGSNIEVLRAKAKNDIEATVNAAGRKVASDAVIASAETLKTTLLGAI